MRAKKLIFLLLSLLAWVSVAEAGGGTRDDIENLYKYRFGADFEIKIVKGLKINIAPELRYNSGFERFNLSGGVSYKTFGCIYWGASYRFDMYREYMGDDQFTGKELYEWETFHRYGFDVTYKDTFKRFTPSLRVRYSNYSDDDLEDKEFLRYRAKLSYNIKKCKITPFAAIEVFEQLSDARLYKMRYSSGFDIKASKHSEFSFEYKLDYFILKYTNAHIFGATYKYTF